MAASGRHDPPSLDELRAGLQDLGAALDEIEGALAIARGRMPSMARELDALEALEASVRQRVAAAEARAVEAEALAADADARAADAEARASARTLARMTPAPARRGSTVPPPVPVPLTAPPSVRALRPEDAAADSTARVAVPTGFPEDRDEDSVDTATSHKPLRSSAATVSPAPASTTPLPRPSRPPAGHATPVPPARPAPPDRPPVAIPTVVQRIADSLLAGSIESPTACRVAERDLDAIANTLEGEASALAGYLLARLRARLDDSAGAHAALKQAWDRSERHGLVALGLGEHFLRSGSPREALGYLDRALRADVRGMRTHSEILVLASEAAVRCGKADIAEAMMVEAAQDTDPPAMVLRALARRALQAGDKSMAVDYLEQMIERSAPAEHVHSVGEFADLLVSLGRAEEAIERLDSTLRSIGGSDAVLDGLERELVALQLGQQQHAGAAATAERRVARGFTPTRAEAHRVAAQAYRFLGEHGREVEHLREARKVEPTSAELAVEYARARDAAGLHSGLERELNDLFLLPTLSEEGRAELLHVLGVTRWALGDAAGAEKAWREAAALGEVESAAKYAEQLAADGERQVEAIGALKSLLVLDPGRLDAIRMLAEIYRAIDAIPEATVCGGLLHLVDPSWPSAEPPPAEAVRAPPADLLQNLCPSELRAAALAASLVWEHGATLLRTDLNAFGVSPSQRLSPLEDVPVASVYAAAIRLLGVPKTAMFLRPFGESLQVAATVPPSVICGTDIAIGVPEVRFRLARAVASTRSEYLLWALPIDQAKAAYEAIRFAFAPSEQALTAVESAMALAQEYSRTLPPKVQRQLREILSLSPLPSFQEARRLADLAVHRAALVATGDPAAALRVVASEASDLADIDVTRPQGFSEAVRRNELARDIVRFALSDAYLTLRFRLEENR